MNTQNFYISSFFKVCLKPSLAMSQSKLCTAATHSKNLLIVRERKLIFPERH